MAREVEDGRLGLTHAHLVAVADLGRDARDAGGLGARANDLAVERALDIQVAADLVGVVVGAQDLAHAPAPPIDLGDDRPGDAGVYDGAGPAGPMVQQKDVVVA